MSIFRTDEINNDAKMIAAWRELARVGNDAEKKYAQGKLAEVQRADAGGDDVEAAKRRAAETSRTAWQTDSTTAKRNK